MVEYGLLVALISLAAVTALMTLANAFRFFANSVSSAGSTSYSH